MALAETPSPGARATQEGAGTRLSRLFRPEVQRGPITDISKNGVQFRTTEPLTPGEAERHLVDGVDCFRSDDSALFDIAESGDFLFHFADEVAVAAAEEDVGLDADGE